MIKSRNIAKNTILSSNIKDGTISGSDIDSSTISASNLKISEVDVTVAAAATSGTATVPSGCTILGYYPTGNQDQFVSSIAVSLTTLTLTLAAAATADNTFKVVVLE